MKRVEIEYVIPQTNYISLLSFINTLAGKSLCVGFQMESKLTLGTEMRPLL
jgi:hypothetical protein